jgi:hypothetical protein
VPSPSLIPTAKLAWRIEKYSRSWAKKSNDIVGLEKG